MKNIAVYPEITSQSVLNNIICRIKWHFSHIRDVNIKIPIANNLLSSEVTFPEGFDRSDNNLDDWLKRNVTFIAAGCENTYVVNSDIVLKHVEGNAEIDSFLNESGVREKIYRVDHKKVRQEGSFYIQAALDLIDPVIKKNMIEDCRKKFLSLKECLGKYNKSWLLATGPSIDNYKKCNFDDAIVIACNSVILNSELTNCTNPKILVFADPIFHFGVSEYAGKFREAVLNALKTTDIKIVVPFKYYPLLVSKFENYSDRIIGIPFREMPEFRLDVGTEFSVKTTANILTLLLLPLAATFSDDINLLGCDGRPLDQDDYFWGHGASVQINDKMKNIQEVHPGFFDIDYNEYYFEHCHTLANLIAQGETLGKKFTHHGPSYIPALRDRSPMPQVDKSNPKESVCVVVEPDGIGMDGHYVRWHQQVISELKSRFKEVQVLCNKKQDEKLYGVTTSKVFSSHSWGISRADFSFTRDFPDAPSVKVFQQELLDALLRSSKDTKSSSISLFMYYGSIQILKVVHEVRKMLKAEGIRLRVTMCLFHESVILDAKVTQPRLPPNAKEILMEGVAQVDDYRILAVTEQLAAHLFEKLGVRLGVFQNPVPSMSDAEQAKVAKSLLAAPSRIAPKPVRVIFPCSPRDEKGGAMAVELMDHMRTNGPVPGVVFVFKGGKDSDADRKCNISYMPADTDDATYRKYIEKSSIVVVPYLAPQFTFRTSGIIVDALAAGKPCIVMEGTWLADVVRKHAAGLPIKYYSPMTILSAVNAISARYRFFETNARKAFAAYIEEHAWKLMADQVIA